MSSDINEFKKYMIDLNIDNNLTEYILSALEGEKDFQSIIVKFEILSNEGIDINSIQDELIENPFFITCEPKEMENNIDTLKKYLKQNEVKNAIEMNPEYLTVHGNSLEQNIKMLKIILPEDKFNMLLKGNGELFTFNSNYLEKRLEFFIKNGFKDRLEEFIIERLDLFDMDEDEIDLKNI